MSNAHGNCIQLKKDNVEFKYKLENDFEYIVKWTMNRMKIYIHPVPCHFCDCTLDRL